MSDSSVLPKSCPKCGAALPSEATDGLCPNCLMNEALQPTQVSDASKPRHSAILAPEMLAPFFPHYEILRMLGRGGMGAVYLARQTSLNRLVAIKILPADLGESDQGFAERFKNEAQAMAQLSHAGIVAVYDFGQTTNGLLYIVMEYIEGTDVQLMLTSQGRLHSAHAMAITAHVCDALQYAHSCGIIHRDIKPSNIMVGNNGVVKVADFGLAKMSHAQTTGLTQSGMAMGTPHFMAPEALTLGSAVDQRADIYAVGVMLYQMLTGKLPQGMFEMPSFQVPGLDPRYDRIVAKALRDDREQRYQAALDLRHDLDAILTQPVEKVAPEAAEVKALPPVEERGRKKARVPKLPPPQAALPEPTRKRPVRLILVVLGVVAAIAAAFVYFRDHGAGSTTQPEQATKEQPFVNSLGMKFVPVPGTNMLMCIHETRRGDYAAYAKESPGVGQLWRNPTKDGIPVANRDDQPVSNVSWTDGQAFCAWLSKKEGRRYRLPTDREWSSAVGIGDLEREGATPKDINAGIKDVYPWGSIWPPGQGAGNYADTLAAGKFSSLPTIMGYADGHADIAPVMSYPPNKLGIHDLGGNVWEWCEDWYDATQTDRFRRGGSYLDSTRDVLLSSKRMHTTPHERQSSEGFRCVVESTAQPVSSSPNLPVSSSPSSATKDAPFTNTLGMKFVPVPITGGPTDGQRMLFSIWETRVQDYEVFVKETKHEWLKPNFGQEPSHPVVNMSWNDAQAFCAWLTAREQKAGKLAATSRYRLPHDHEWSCAVGIGEREAPEKTPQQKHNQINDLYPWGTAWPPPKGAGNYADESAKARQSNSNYRYIQGYDDGFAWTAPVGSFAANPFGLYDLGGNAHEMCEDRRQPDQPERTGRGGSYGMAEPRRLLQLSDRSNDAPDKRIMDRGFRCVLESSEPAVSPSTSLGTIKDAPFTNTLGMKFVPVPINGGPTDEQRVLFSTWVTRVQDYEVFAKESGRLWPKAGFEQGPTHPAININWEDAQAFCAWITDRERKAGRLGAGEVYRLPSDHEWSCAVGLGKYEDPRKSPPEKHGQIQGVYPWGTRLPPPDRVGNLADTAYHEQFPNEKWLEGYTDGYAWTSPVGSFPANEHGLYDMSGNVWQWCEDFMDASTNRRVMRGSSYANRPFISSNRKSDPATTRFDHGDFGFRIVLAPAVVTTASSPAVATKEAPFINNLGMKFVPVPGTKVLFCIHEARYRDYATYAAETPGIDNTWKDQSVRGFVSSENREQHPVMKVGWEDAQRFCEWLSRKEGKKYRLPTDEEWSFAVGLGNVERQRPLGATPAMLSQKENTLFPWGGDFPPKTGDKAGNYSDASRKASTPDVSTKYLEDYDDHFPTTAPVMSFKPNELGLYDMGGNVWEWCVDWYDATQTERMLRGGSWEDPGREVLLSSNRRRTRPDHRPPSFGFRVVLEISDETVAPAKSPDTAPVTPATKIEEASVEHPFTNTLGMKFVAVPIGGGPTAGKRVLFSIWDTRVQDYLTFARTNKVDGRWQEQQKDGVPVGREFDHPVVGVNWEDAQAFCQWLTAKEAAEGKLPPGMKYRLPSDEEWSWAVGLPHEPGATPAEKTDKNTVDFPWGIGFPPPDKRGNYADETFHAKVPKHWVDREKDLPWITGYNDGYATTSPVGSFPANVHGLYDMGGNVWQWCEDWFDKDQKQRVLRGASWDSPDRNTLLSSRRRHSVPQERGSSHGFRCVLAAAGDTASASPTLPVSTASKESPFTNTLGMKFVPVPINGEPSEGNRVLFSVWETRVQDYGAFAKETKREWLRTDFVQGPTHPAVKVSWDDAQAFCVWLTEKERKEGILSAGARYRLPTDHEWSCAAGIGEKEDAGMTPAALGKLFSDAFPWGTGWPPPTGAGNYAGEEMQPAVAAGTYKSTPILAGYNDGFVETAPAGSFPANRLGLHDLGGNAWEWCEDWYDESKTERVMRGASWLNRDQSQALLTVRGKMTPDTRNPNVGFRCVLDDSKP